MSKSKDNISIAIDGIAATIARQVMEIMQSEKKTFEQARIAMMIRSNYTCTQSPIIWAIAMKRSNKHAI